MSKNMPRDANTWDAGDARVLFRSWPQWTLVARAERRPDVFKNFLHACVTSGSSARRRHGTTGATFPIRSELRNDGDPSFWIVRHALESYVLLRGSSPRKHPAIDVGRAAGLAGSARLAMTARKVMVATHVGCRSELNSGDAREPLHRGRIRRLPWPRLSCPRNLTRRQRRVPFEITPRNFIDFVEKENELQAGQRAGLSDRWRCPGWGRSYARRIQRIRSENPHRLFHWLQFRSSRLSLSFSNSPPSRLMQYSASIQSRCSLSSQSHTRWKEPPSSSAVQRENQIAVRQISFFFQADENW